MEIGPTTAVKRSYKKGAKKHGTQAGPRALPVIDDFEIGRWGRVVVELAPNARGSMQGSEKFGGTRIG